MMRQPFFFQIGPFPFYLDKFYDQGPSSAYYYFDSHVDLCLDIDIERGFRTPATAQRYALKKVKRLYKQIGEAL